MDETGAWITLTLLCIVAVVFGIWWKFIRGRERAGANRSTGSSESGGLDGEDSTIAIDARRGVRTARSIKYLGWMLTTVALLGALGLGLRTWMRYEILHPLLVGVSLMIASRKLRTSSEELPSMSNNPAPGS